MYPSHGETLLHPSIRMEFEEADEGYLIAKKAWRLVSPEAYERICEYERVNGRDVEFLIALMILVDYTKDTSQFFTIEGGYPTGITQQTQSMVADMVSLGTFKIQHLKDATLVMWEHTDGQPPLFTVAAPPTQTVQ